MTKKLDTPFLTFAFNVLFRVSNPGIDPMLRTMNRIGNSIK